MLRGASTEERFRDFAETRLAGAVRLRAVFDEYPVLGRRMHREVERWRDATTELLRRFETDRAVLHRVFARGSPPVAMAALGGELSDPIRGAGTVRRVDLQDGTRVVYKPSRCGWTWSSRTSWAGSASAAFGIHTG